MKKRGYFATLIGCSIGGFLLGVAGLWLGIVYVDRYMPYAELEGILPPLVGTVVGSGVGAGGGTWLALRIRRYRGAGITGFIVCIAAPILLVVGALVGDQITQAGSASLWLAVIFAAVTASFGARGVVVLGSGSDWDSPPISDGLDHRENK